MAELTPQPFGRLASRLVRELDERGSAFDLPARGFFTGNRSLDFSIDFHGREVSSPLGPASGPHTQLAQNIVLAWLAGARVFELKTVQVKDRLAIPRPCIDMRNVGYNVEWSQELTLEQSLEEYIKASMLIDILKARGVGLAPGFDRECFDMSVGYDLAGIRSEGVRAFIQGLQDARPAVERLRRRLPPDLARFKDLDFTTRISRSLTLSTFHGCPPGEIEAMAAVLMSDCGLDVVVKLNPTLLGRPEVERLLREELGYEDVRVPPEAVEKDASWDRVAEFLGRLDLLARGLGRSFGVKLCNTLVVENPGDFLPAGEPTRYLSGPPLHVLAMQLVLRLRRAFGDRIPVSFSAGIDRFNFPDAVALGLVPVTTCSDLLKPGGYGRLKGYYDELSKRMEAAGASDIDSFVRASCHASSLSAADARLRNTEAYVPHATLDPRYRRRSNAQAPRKIGRALSYFDCLACDKCVTACPNGANFVYHPPAASIPQVRLAREGEAWVRRTTGSLATAKKSQIANFADFCNECGNCDAFCPEDGGPFKAKPRFFGSLKAWTDSPLDGFYAARDGEAQLVFGRLGGREHLLTVDDATMHCDADGLHVAFPLDGADGPVEGDASAETDLTPFFIMEALRRALLSPGAVNHVNA